MSVTRFRALSIVVAAAGATLVSGAAAQANPGWFASAEYLYGWRSVDSDGLPAIAPLAGPGAVYTTGGVKLGGRSGMDLRAGYDGKAWGIDARYFGGFHWAGGPQDLGAVGNVRIGPFSNFGATDLTAALDSRFSTFEVNLRSMANNSPFTVFAGIRTLDFNDQATFHIVFPTFNADYHFMDPTKGVGVQVGAEGHFALSNGVGYELLFADLDVRGGLMEEKTNQAFVLLPSTGGSFPGGANGKKTSAFFEAGINVGHRIGPFSVEAGYRAFFLSKVPTAEGYAAEALADSTQNGSVVYHSLLVQTFTVGAKVQF